MTDRTEHQSDEQLRQSKKLSVQPTRPPAKIEGYTIQDFVGRGSYGEVWTAIDQKTGKRVAIKFYAQRSNSDVKQLAQEVEKLVVLAPWRIGSSPANRWESNAPWRFFMMWPWG